MHVFYINMRGQTNNADVTIMTSNEPSTDIKLCRMTVHKSGSLPQRKQNSKIQKEVRSMKNNTMRKVLSITMAFSMLAGMGGSSIGTLTALADDAGDDTLSIAAWDKNFNIPALKAAEKDYQTNVDPDFKLDIIEESQSSDIETLITNAAAAGDYSTVPDVVLFQDHYFNKYHTDYPDAWVALDGADVDWSDFSEEKLSYSTVDGVHYGFPVDNGTVICAYRTDLLEQAGYTIDDLTGVTWENFIKIGKDVYDKTGKYLLSMDGDGNDLPYMMMQAEGASQFKDGEEGYASNGGSSLYITANCQNVDLAKKFLAYTFGGGSVAETGTSITYDDALTNGGVITTCISAGKSDVYSQGVEFFNNQPIYSKIVEMGSHVPVVEQSDYHYPCRTYVAAAIINIHNGADIDDELKNAEDQLRFEMGL